MVENGGAGAGGEISSLCGQDAEQGNVLQNQGQGWM